VVKKNSDMLKIKSPKPHNFSVFTELVENIDFEKLIGRMDDKGHFIENETEAEIDGKMCLIKIKRYFKENFAALGMLDFIWMNNYGFDGRTAQSIFKKKYPEKINAKTEVAIILYELIEIGN
jgi:hypothetical protein